ncbi:3-hydroxyisobutyryl-CoA hydrolase-like protein 3, mitochondrial [Chenopodium quinoa]|uniref:3-hydroxyisobutyryl-CoA hydrolase-like protein 3, mitochondrial n=1 Tax=Chenopodium quinoa TaxID=63459 RepID=UPI000B78B7A6|nr:3-hydroxyisobutyryl-CoA hydrolase-like protein 3, mitochondrial [Chenopodium quinoa]
MASASDADKFVKGKIHANGVAVITLDRPKALNAMTSAMSIKFKSLIDEWEEDAKVKCVLVESSGSPRSFCVGGDVKYMTGIQDLPALIEIFTAEYGLICKISEYKKPFISFIDGITMGMGIGLSGHGQYRVVTERTLFAMPENSIGLFPDIGFSYIAANSPGDGSVGAYIGMTGKRISNPADALYSGLGTHYVPSSFLGSLKESLLASAFSGNPYHEVAAILSNYSTKPHSEPQLKLLLSYIASAFNANKSVSEIFDELKRHQQSSDDIVAGWAKEALKGLGRGAPFSLCLTHRYYAKVASAVKNNDAHLSNVIGVMKLEYRIAIRASQRKDVVEGVRALLVDKDQNPKWTPSSVKEVDMQEVEAIFEPFEPNIPELRFKSSKEISLLAKI